MPRAVNSSAPQATFKKLGVLVLINFGVSIVWKGILRYTGAGVVKIQHFLVSVDFGENLSSC